MTPQYLCELPVRLRKAVWWWAPANGADLCGASPQVIVGWFDPDEENVPFDMFAGGGGASAREGLIQQDEIGHLVDLRQKPVGKTATAGARNLPA